MRIAVNTRLLLKDRLDGIGWFSYETLRRITVRHPEHEFIFLFDRKFDPEFIFSSNVRGVITGPQARHPVLWYFWFEWSVPRILRKERADLFVSPDGYLPLRGTVPSVAVIHDINFLHRPGDLPLSSRWYYNHYFPEFARRAKRIGTVSEYSKADICRSYGVEPSKISVLYNGINEHYKPVSDREKQAARDRTTGGTPYFIYIGTLHPRKNIPGLLKAYDLFREETGSAYRLVIVGEKMFMTSEIDRTFSGMKHRAEVIFTGRMDPAELQQVLASAEALVFVPFFEGFGIPVIEAMKCGVPVIASDATSLPEVAGGAALLSGPEDFRAIANHMRQVTTDPGLRSGLVSSGLKRAENFSWDRTADKFWDLIENTVNDA